MSPFGNEMRSTLGGDFAISPVSGFADLLWDMRIEEVLAIEPGVIVDSKETPRRIVLLPVRGEIRYWLTTDRDAMREETALQEIGIVAATDAIALCREFLATDALPRHLATRRVVPAYCNGPSSGTGGTKK